MVLPKKSIANLYRTQSPETTRLDMLRLDKNENITGMDPGLVEKARAMIDSNFITAYPEPYTLYKKISKTFGIDENMLYLSAGSDAAIKSIFEVFVGEGEEIVIPHPTYAMYYVYPEMFGAGIKKVGYEKDFSFDVEKFKQAITEKTSLVCIANPNSPTGTIIEEKELLDIIRHAGQKGALVLVDEAYYPYYPHSIIKHVNEFDNLIVSRTFSKAYGLASARLGLAVSNPKLIGLLKKVRPLYEVNSYAVMMGNLVLDNPQVLERNLREYTEGKAHLVESLKKMGLKYYEGYANFVSMDMGSQQRAERVGQELEKLGVLVKSTFKDVPLANHVRASIGSKEQMEQFVQKLRIAIKNVDGK